MGRGLYPSGSVQFEPVAANLPARIRIALGAFLRARVQERVQHEPVGNEEVLVDVQRRLAAVEIPGAVAFYAMPQHQVLCPRRRADRVGLHEAQLAQRARQRRRAEQAARDGEAHRRLRYASGARPAPYVRRVVRASCRSLAFVGTVRTSQRGGNGTPAQLVRGPSHLAAGTGIDLLSDRRIE